MTIVVPAAPGGPGDGNGDLTALKARIASELHRSDLTAAIASAITTAISYYRSKRFEFNELQASFNTVADQESYTSGDTGFPTDLGEIDTIRITVSGTRYLLAPVSFAELQALSTTTTATGRPTRFSWYAQTLFMNPIPDAVYSVLVSYQQRKSAPAYDGDTSTVWTNQCEALIRACAKKLICRDVTRDAQGFQAAQAAEAEALAVLERESLQLQDEGGLAPNW
jgi:hypothetical protein